jgi:micrococcal nuclease
VRAIKRIPWAVVAVIAGILSLAIYSHVIGSDAHVVKKVIDGDTIILDDGRHVRLIGVDAPEVDSPYRNVEPFGDESKDYMKRLVERRLVTIKIGPEPYDKYGRTLAYVYLGPTMVNSLIIRDGYAKAYRRFRFPERDLFINYEKEAKAKGVGMWKYKWIKNYDL